MRVVFALLSFAKGAKSTPPTRRTPRVCPSEPCGPWTRDDDEAAAMSSILALLALLLQLREGCGCPASCSCLGALVDCARRGLGHVPHDLPPWTEILDLQRNEIEAANASSFRGLESLAELDLSNNRLHLLNNSTFQNLGFLQKLVLSHNHLVEFPSLGQNSNLTHLSLEHNAVHSLDPLVLAPLPRLQLLDLSSNALVHLPSDTLGNSTHLKHLVLSHNRLVSVERGVFDGVPGLESLRLGRNRLPALPRDLFNNLTHLQHLELSSNALTVVEGLSFQGLSALLVLKMRHGTIATLQDGAFYGLSAIRKLQLDFNNIGKVTKGWLYGLNSLQRLYVNNNNISEIEDDAWDSSRRLVELDLSHNRLGAVGTRTFDRLHALRRLLLGDNRIAHIEEDAFRPLSALQHLELQNNAVWWSVEDGSRVFTGLGRLRFLGLSGNGLRRMGAGALSGLARLHTLNLTRNPLAVLEEGALSHTPQLQHLVLNSSSLVCDCRLSWLASLPSPVERATCGYPERLRGSSALRLPPSLPCSPSPLPQVVSGPPTTIALKGENVTLECSANTTRPPLTFHWRKDGKLLSSVRHPQRSASLGGGAWRSVLGLVGVRDDDEGRYQCVADNAYGAAFSPKARITVHVFPVFTKTPADVSVRAGSTARLECGARGQPRPDVSWQKDAEDFPAARERRMHVMPTDDVFFIVGVKPQDAGRYSCTATNLAGTIVANATLTVLETPSFVRPMEDKEARAGETAVLECLAGGSPRPSLRWEREGGRPLRPTERHFFTAQDQLLIIVQARAEDAGAYTCTMTNALGTEKGTSVLRVTQVAGSGVFGEDSHAALTTGVVVIAVVICIVGTSLIWVVIIYHTRKRRGLAPPATPFLDTHSVSGVSKGGASSAGDSGRQSSDELLAEEERRPLHRSASSVSRWTKDVPRGDSFSLGEEGRCHSSPTLCPPT
ncbi:hypothetical protein JTE90_006130 [Oedothorax gibbosus]|uniref:Ig-like domain-containing protein n=1 Tax=Oedothorax gibbosus TaxID=931172 RepID=A0AAV6V6P6_9ARAC|nr:hypothetical protein JTE90_006130 [Oedothorax gibbosus]